MDRRKFIMNGSLLGCSLAASPLLTPVTLASTPGDARLVVIILRGAMDGLDVVRPYGDKLLKAYRPRVGSADPTHDLDGFFSLHPSLAGLMPLWHRQDLAFAHAVSTPYRDKRSHFDGQDLLEAGTGSDVDIPRDGWLNRLLQVMPNATSQTAFAVGREEMRLMAGPSRTSSWSPEGRLDMSVQARLLLEHMYHEDPLFRDAGIEAMEVAESLGVVGDDVFANSRSQLRRQAAGAPQADILAEFAAKRLNEDTRIAAFSISGWDTHKNQSRGIKRALDRLQASILTLKRDLRENWQKTAIVAMTEFGRTARENGSGGTDHGTGGALIIAGGAVRGGKVFGDWPGLEEAQLYARRDLMPTRDVRAYPAWLMQDMFNVETSMLERVVFPGLDLGQNPKITK